MRLKQLELMGFKSFASKVKLEFESGITAIVGPNGSGKSNISDAIRWVLGEHSARSLRGAKMEDIIFAGTDGKRPLGMAEVHLTLDNTDQFLPVEYNEVTIARRVYRSGESQFLINRHPCRLKDIHDLFTDTGLGREGYAIIGQGQIDAVLSARSYDRRILLEETAGIIKYRTKKEEALRKMEKVDQDASRVQDILSEIEGRIGPLRQEAEKARTYQQLASQLLTAELDHFSIRLNTLEEKRQQYADSLHQRRGNHQKLTAELADLENAVAELQQQATALETEIEELNDSSMECSENWNRAASEEELAKERLQHCTGEVERLEKEQSQRRCRIQEQEEARQRQREALERLDRELTDAAASLKELTAAEQAHREKQQQSLDELEEQKNLFMEFLRDLADARNAVRSVEQEQSSLAQRQQALQQTLSESLQEHERLKEEWAELEQALQAVQNQRQETSNDLKDAKERLQEYADAHERLRQLLEELQRKQRHIVSRKQALQDLEDSYEGYFHSVRRLMTDAPSDLPLVGTVADVIRVPTGWETAIEIALGSAVQHIITNTKADAQQGIDWLKKQQAGRATFLPLDSMRGQAFPESYNEHWQRPGVIGPAMNHIEVEAGCEAAVASVLGRVALTETLDDAVALKNKLGSFSRIVTRDGDVIAPSGAMTGGSIKARRSGLLSRRQEIASLDDQAEKLQGQLDETEAQLATATHRREQAEQCLSELRETDRQYQSQIDKHGYEREQYNRHLQRSQQTIERLQRQKTELDERQAQLEDEKSDAEHRASSMEDEETNRRDHIAALETQCKAEKSDAESLQDQLTAAKVAKTKLQGQRDQAEQNLQYTVQILSELSQESTEVRQQIDDLRQKHGKYQQDLGKSQAAQQALQQQRQQIRSAIEAAKGKRSQIQSDLAAKQKQEKQLRSRASQEEKAIHKLEMENRGVELELQQIAEEAANRDCLVEDIMERDVERSSQQLSRAIARLRGEIKELGLVNPTAVDEYEQLRQRQSFLQSQYDDLQEARAALQSVIREMDQTSEKRFAETYRQVRREFQNIFARLFNGGRADLILSEPEELLTTGVEVVAQPPGKKLQNLLLLSGGERSLTAIALMFAIRRVKPTPFCVLDEIDASLDDSNLHRFAALMEEFAEDTQFLVITHRTVTMESADALYGVTMEHSAASQLMSVKLA